MKTGPRLCIMKNEAHTPVLCNEIIHLLRPKSPERYIDGTVGAGGHARVVLEACAPDGCLLGLDLDPQALALARENLAPYGKRVILVQASYASLLEVMSDRGWESVDGIVLDLGVSSMQLDSPGRGFSFQSEAPLDMRFKRDSGLTAEQLINSTPEADLAELLFKFGEEPRAKRIAHMIVQAAPIKTTTQLAEIVRRAYPGHSRVHPATRTFQALRIAVNNELAILESSLPRAIQALHTGGRLAVISFHSLEDRIVKDFFRSNSKDQINPPYERIFEVERRALLKEINRKPLTPDVAEIKENPRSRSAKLRVAEKLAV